MREILITEDDPISERIDKFLTQFLEGHSRSAIQGWLEEGHIQVNGENVKSNYKIQENDKIIVDIPQQEEKKGLEPENLDIPVIYEDQDIAVVLKEKDLVVHPAPGNTSGTLANGLMYQFDQLSDVNGEYRPGIVHRLDKDTSGLLVIAKNNESHYSLAQQFKNQMPLREYQVLVHGNIQNDKGKIDAPIGRNPSDRLSYIVISDGKESITHFEVDEHFEGYTLVSARLETGRTHQIRVHFKFIQHPVVGDEIYGPKNTYKEHGQYLFAKKLGFTHPRTAEYMEFEAPLPDYFEETIECLRERGDEK